MEVRGASFCVAKATFRPRMLLTMTVIGDCVAASMIAGYRLQTAYARLAVAVDLDWNMGCGC